MYYGDLEVLFSFSCLKFDLVLFATWIEGIENTQFSL